VKLACSPCYSSKSLKKNIQYGIKKRSKNEKSNFDSVFGKHSPLSFFPRIGGKD
jgi:hypothetical protein